MEENKYHPLTFEEFQEMDAIVSSLGAYLPEDKAPYIWDNFNKLRNEREPRPCMCGSAGAHWKRAVDYLTDWTKQRK